MSRKSKNKNAYSPYREESYNFVSSNGSIHLKPLSYTNSLATATTTTFTAPTLSSLTLPKATTSERNDECGHNSVVSGTGAVATCFFLIGLLMYLVAFASHDWLGLERGTTISLWRNCHRDFVIDVWSCKPWGDLPG
ncbi:hypothetical protein PoB_003363600 [Plakobranchus ocellatus]|uniref:Uncharacterized protein n=1 Tax=Plakobranchus ocellatus TaxID=259542 RepID=A0AAV4AFP3_9GAST|nr:hypothetical protein PoB_003363600 [Plakobranchus ocellatus]